MKYVKSLLALAFAALLGTAAQAKLVVDTDSVTVEVGGEPATVTVQNTSGSNAYDMSIGRDDPQTTTWETEFYRATIPSDTLAAGGSFDLTIEGLKATTEPQTLLVTRIGAGTSNFSTNITIVVTSGSGPIRESVSIANGESAVKTLEGEDGDSWTAAVTTGSEYVEVSPASFTGANFELTINALAETATPATVTVKKNGENFAIYTVTVTKGPDFVMFMGQKIFYSNATTNMVSGELLLTFTNTAAAGTFKLPKEFDARVLIVGGGAGGLGSYGKNNQSNGYASNGGNGGSVVEKTLDDAFVLSSGDYTVTVGKGGNSVAGTTSSGTGYWNVNNPGAKSSLEGGEDPLEAAGGTAFSGLAQTTKINNKVDDGGTQQDDQGAICVKNKTSLYYSHDGKGAGAGESEKWVKTGATSDISGAEVIYGVGGAGGATGNGTEWVKIEGTSGAPANTGNGGAGGSNGGAGGKGADGIVIVRLFSKNYTITTVADPVEGGTVTGGGEYAPDAEATLTATANAGYSFWKWQDDSTENPRTITVTADAEYMATFTANVYTVTLEKNGGTCADLASYTYGVGATLPADAAKTDLTFGGWYTNATFKGDAWTSIGATETGDKEFWAKWNAVFTIQVPENVNLTTVTNAQGVAIVSVGDTYTVPEGTSLSIVYTVKDGYKFVGNTTEYVQNVTPVNGEVKSTAPKTVQAQYDVTLEKNDGECTDLTTYEYGVVTQLPTDATKEGFSFAGWYTNETFLGEAWTEIGKDETGDKTFWAKWDGKATEIEVPTAIEDLTYNGNVQTGVLAGVGYTITGNVATNAGYHVATAKLEEGYVWAGGLEGDQPINWSIAKKPITVTPDEGQSIIVGKPYTITYKTDVDLAEGDTFTGALEPSDDGEEGSDVLIQQGSLEINDGNNGENYQLDFEEEVWIHIYAASQEVNPTGSDPIKVDTDWILKNLPGVDPENEGDVSTAMAVGCPNQNDLWVNYVLNTDTNESIRVVSTQSVGGVFFDLNSLGIRPDSGATVHAMVEFTPAGGVPSTVVSDQELPISITDITESGKYTVSFWIKNETEEESTTPVTVGNDEVGALVKDGYKSGSARELVSVPWSDLASEDGDITVENFLVTKNLAEGTKLYSLAEGGAYYDAWELSSDKKWKPVKTVKIVGGVVTVQVPDTPETATLKCGTGVWVERADASAKLVFIGATSDEDPMFTPANGWTLGSVTGYDQFNLKTMVNDAHVGDQVMEPTASGTPKVYTYDSTGWGYDEVIDDGDFADVKRVTTGDMKLPAGSGFWYQRKAEEPK